MFVQVFYEIRKPKRLNFKTSLFGKSKFWQIILRLKKLDQDVESIFTSSCFFDAEKKNVSFSAAAVLSAKVFLP